MSTSQSDFALQLAENGFCVFPCEVNGKLPTIKDYPHRATIDAAQIRSWWNGKQKNIGISTSHFGAGEALLVLDIDLKNDKRGDLSLMRLELEGFDLPSTFEVTTP